MFDTLSFIVTVLVLATAQCMKGNTKYALFGCEPNAWTNKHVWP